MSPVIRPLRGPRLIGVVALVALLSLGGGVALSRFVVSPAQLQAEASGPEAGPITAPIEQRVIQNTVTTRADVTHADAVDVKADTTGLAGPAVVTGHVPEVGAVLEAGSVALEVAGRPVIVLRGALPAYRTLHAGLSGPDVLELKSSLAALGLDPGDQASDRYDAATAEAVKDLYQKAGYPVPRAEEAEQRLAAALQAERAASAAVDQAAGALRTASNRVTDSGRLELDNAVRQAQRELDAAVAAGHPQTEQDALSDALALAFARRAELDSPPDVSAETAALDGARAQLADAQNERAAAEEEALTPLPAGEVVYLSSLPRRVDEVSTERGATLQGVALRVSGAELVLEGSVGEADAALLKPGMPARFTTDDGTERGATVKSVEPHKDGQGSAGAPGAADAGAGNAKKYDVVLTPETLSDDLAQRILGSNVRLSIPVQATDGQVLAVPVAALTAGASGESRIELAADEGESSLVTVSTGLSAGGLVEIRSDDPRVAAGARVVVGR